MNADSADGKKIYNRKTITWIKLKHKKIRVLRARPRPINICADEVSGLSSYAGGKE